MCVHVFSEQFMSSANWARIIYGMRFMQLKTILKVFECTGQFSQPVQLVLTEKYNSRRDMGYTVDDVNWDFWVIHAKSSRLRTRANRKVTHLSGELDLSACLSRWRFCFHPLQLVNLLLMCGCVSNLTAQSIYECSPGNWTPLHITGKLRKFWFLAFYLQISWKDKSFLWMFINQICGGE